MSSPERQPPQMASEPQARVSRRVAIRSIAAATAVAAGTGGAVWLAGASGIWPPRRGDDVSDAEQQERIKAFAALGSLPLSIVSDGDRARAVESMNLSPEARESLLAALGGEAHLNTGPAPAASTRAAASSSATPEVKPSSATGQGGPVSHAKAQSPSTERKSAQLAWVTLWDSDVEDGDAVRIESGGYARTIVLTKRGITFAVPVPQGGQIHLIGVQDGDGGGITVGLASGAAKVLLPVMSVGQVLALNVRVN